MLQGKGKDGGLEVIDSGWVGAGGDKSFLEDLKDLGPPRGPSVVEWHLAVMKGGMEDWAEDSGRLEGRKRAVVIE